MNCSSVRSGGTWLFSIPIRAAITFLPIDLRLAPTGRQTFLRHERQNDFAAPGGLLQRFLPALAGRNAALGSGSRSRKTSFQPFSASQSRTSMALSLLRLE